MEPAFPVRPESASGSSRSLNYRIARSTRFDANPPLLGRFDSLIHALLFVDSICLTRVITACSADSPRESRQNLIHRLPPPLTRSAGEGAPSPGSRLPSSP